VREKKLLLLSLSRICVQDADKDIMKYLKEHGRLVHQGTIAHQYPYCWRFNVRSGSS